MNMRFVLTGILGLVLAVAAAGAVRADDGCSEPASAPAAQAPAANITGSVRVIDGDSIDTNIDGKRTAVGLIGITAAPGNTPCGERATMLLRSLVADGLRLEEDPEIVLDERGRRMYYALTADGRSIAQELVRAGVAAATRTGREADSLRTAETEARDTGARCL
jgi:endonuclease YncB( thermonuclease family)